MQGFSSGILCEADPSELPARGRAENAFALAEMALARYLAVGVLSLFCLVVVLRGTVTGNNADGNSALPIARRQKCRDSGLSVADQTPVSIARLPSKTR